MKDAWPKHSEIVNEKDRGDIHLGMGMTRGWRSLCCSFWARFVKNVGIGMGVLSLEEEDVDGLEVLVGFFLFVMEEAAARSLDLDLVETLPFLTVE